eukprot:CAMPEP_0194522990 /NCGR_PEP_ID=MMETSP0253-20130528/57754_1 /TAXON_ID=2966 /ORGANISM="Noctiluca scintillans" /LENGTH=135 /DNA_ID=CAMNT_0039367481 /DNA_START=186 /DNA_END=589 /DNA_ORIENTATION=-
MRFAPHSTAVVACPTRARCPSRELIRWEAREKTTIPHDTGGKPPKETDHRLPRTATEGYPSSAKGPPSRAQELWQYPVEAAQSIDEPFQQSLPKAEPGYDAQRVIQSSTTNLLGATPPEKTDNPARPHRQLSYAL